jgi:hypothetical protein
MQVGSRRWQDAEREHARSVAALLTAASLVPDEKWILPLGVERWSPAQVMEHIEISYALGRDAVRGGAGMRLKRPPLVAWLSRRIMLPLMSWTGRFPAGVPAPREVRPDAARAHAVPRLDAVLRIQRAAAEALTALREAEGRGGVTMTHAYLGPLTPYETLRLLNAHTRHHAKLLAPPKIVGKSAPCVPELEATVG